MNRYGKIAVMVVVVLVGWYVAFGQQQRGGMIRGGMMQRQSGADKGMMMSKAMMERCPMHMMMCKSMMSKHMVATEDGAVVVLAGNKLVKYDKDLNVTEEAELKIDMEKMQQKMKKMMEDCPMRQMMQQQMQGRKAPDHGRLDHLRLARVAWCSRPESRFIAIEMQQG